MPLPEFNLEEKAYVVTGGGRNLGVALTGGIVEAGTAKVYCRISSPNRMRDGTKTKKTQKQRPETCI
jgi:NAD(P)-dependent dehydrogenase (short-subunit alcohol dehydrogenase family)